MKPLRIDGALSQDRAWSWDELRALPNQEENLARLAPGRDGAAISLGALIALAEPHPEADRVTLTSADGGFEATVPLDGLGDAWILYRRGEEPLPGALGGPYRVVIPESAQCGQGPLDACANVKDLGMIRVHTPDGPEFGAGKPDCD